MSIPPHLFRTISPISPVFPPPVITGRPAALFVGYAPHQKTLSSNFLTDLLSTGFDVYRSSLVDVNTNFNPPSEMRLPKFKLVVIWQVMPSIIDLCNRIEADKVVFFPMADQYYLTGEYKPIWDEYKQVPIISFSARLQKDLTELGFDCTYYKFFPKPIADLTSCLGDPHSAFLWERTSAVTPATVTRLMAGYKISGLHVHRVADNGKSQPAYPAGAFPFPITESAWFKARGQMTETMQNHGIYFAPRQYEGIGMSFLEAMAMGRCVIAPDGTTMNEYITDGETGYLYDHCDPMPIRGITADGIRQIQHQTLELMQEGYRHWITDQQTLLDSLS